MNSFILANSQSAQVISVQSFDFLCKSDHWFLYEMKYRAEMGNGYDDCVQNMQQN